METLKNEIRNFMEDETGMGTVEIICKSLYAKCISTGNQESPIIKPENPCKYAKKGRRAL